MDSKATNEVTGFASFAYNASTDGSISVCGHSFGLRDKRKGSHCTRMSHRIDTAHSAEVFGQLHGENHIVDDS